MGDEPTTPPVDPQAGKTEDPQPQAGTQTTPEPQAGDGQDTTISLDEAKKLRSESANLRKRLKEFEALNTELKTFKEKIEQDKLTDTEKQTVASQKREQQLSEYQLQNSELTRQLQEVRVTNEVFKQASKLSIIDIDAAAKLLDSSQIEYDDNGSPTNIDALLKDMVGKRTWLLAKQQAPSAGGSTNPSRTQASAPTQLTEEYVKRIAQNPAEFNSLPPERQQEIQAFIGKMTRFR
jgi:hypothetical protein